MLKREENLKEEQRFRLRDLLGYNLKTVRGYLLKEAFQQLWDYNSRAWAGKFPGQWVGKPCAPFRAYRVLELALYHSVGKLPEPESTHDFF